MFVITIVNVAVLPALTVPPSGVLATVTSGHCTTTVPVAWSVPSLLVETLAVFETVMQSAGVGRCPEMWTDQLPPAGRLASVQLRTSGVGTVSIEQVTPARPGR